MSNEFNLDDLITKIKTFALTNGYTKVDAYKFNPKSNADTQLPKLYIKLAGIGYDKFLNGAVEKKYRLELTTIVAAAELKPAITIESLTDVLLRALFTDNSFFNNISVKNKIEIEDFELTDDETEFDRFGGAFGTLKINILNTEFL